MAEVNPLSVSRNEIGDIKLAVGKIDARLKKENAASLIGFFIVVIFGITVIYLMHMGSLLFVKFNGVSNQDFASFVRDALNPFLKECATTLGTIFGSTLGFVLGYYFKEATSNKSNTANEEV